VENRYKIRITPKAEEDLNEIFSYISLELANNNAANVLMSKIESSIMRLQDFPFSCSSVEDELLKEKGYRKLIVDNYIVFYIADELMRQVVVMRVLYGRQKYQGLV